MRSHLLSERTDQAAHDERKSKPRSILRRYPYRISATTIGVWMLVLLVLGHGLVGLPQIYHMAVYHESPLTVSTYTHCTMLTCIDWTRQCSRGNLNASVYIYPSIPTAAFYLGAVASPQYDSLLDRVRASRFYTSNPTEACLFIPPFFNLCAHNRCLPTHMLLPAAFHALPFWSRPKSHFARNFRRRHIHV